MNAIVAYVLGLLTAPALAGLGWLLINAIAWVYYRLMKPHGLSIEFKGNRDTNRIPDWTLRRDIWFERQRGPIFTGHWYREVNERRLATRWLGIGRRNGRSVMFFKLRTLS